MVELFNIIKQQKSFRLQIHCNNLSFFRCDSPTDLIEYLENHLDYYIIEHFDVTRSIKDLEAIDVSVSYISSFNIDLFMSEEDYNFINENYHRTIVKYDFSPIDLNKYRLKFQE